MWPQAELNVRLNQSDGAITEIWRIIREKDTHQRDIIRLQRRTEYLLSVLTILLTFNGKINRGRSLLK